MNDSAGCLLVLAVLCLVAGLLAIPFVFVTDTEIPRAYRLLLVAIPIAFAIFLAGLGFNISDGRLPAPLFWLLLLVPFALFLHYCT